MSCASSSMASWLPQLLLAMRTPRIASHRLTLHFAPLALRDCFTPELRLAQQALCMEVEEARRGHSLRLPGDTDYGVIASHLHIRIRRHNLCHPIRTQYRPQTRQADRCTPRIFAPL